eukprot:17743-Heterococcus_DN1.PRE.2
MHVMCTQVYLLVISASAMQKHLKKARAATASACCWVTAAPARKGHVKEREKTLHCLRTHKVYGIRLYELLLLLLLPSAAAAVC